MKMAEMSALLTAPLPSTTLSEPILTEKSKQPSNLPRTQQEYPLQRSARMGGLVVLEDLELIKKHRQARLQREAALTVR